VFDVGTRVMAQASFDQQYRARTAAPVQRFSRFVFFVARTHS
jgi:hypothetical protein